MTGDYPSQFRSEQELLAMDMIAKNESDIILILRTGEGKTAVTMGPVLRETKVSVWITIFRALTVGKFSGLK